MTILNEQEYKNKNRLLYHGSDRSEPSVGNIFFVSNDIKYALFFASYKSNSENGGFVHVYRLKENLNIFNAKQISDMKRLTIRTDIKESNANIQNSDMLKIDREPSDNELYILQNRDWLFFLGEKRRDEIVDVIRRYNIYDGFLTLR